MSNTKISKLQIFLNGLIKENPVLVLVLGTCPTLAVTTAAINVFPSPVGRHTSVFSNSASRTTLYWYSRFGRFTGYTHVFAASLS